MSLCPAINALSIVNLNGCCGKHVIELCTTCRCCKGRACFVRCHFNHAGVLRQRVEKHKHATSSPHVMLCASIITLVAMDILIVLHGEKIVGKWAAMAAMGPLLAIKTSMPIGLVPYELHGAIAVIGI